ncbi:uncharacterized protein LOC144129917 [Amblyomma americanum]
MLALALLIVVGGYVYQKMLRERERSNSLSAKVGRSVHADTLSSSSATHIPATGRPCEGSEEYGQWVGYGDVRLLRTMSEQSLPLHPPRYISHKAANHEEAGLSTLHECCSVVERSSPSLLESGSSEQLPRKGADTPLHRTLKEHNLVGQDKRENIAKPERNDHDSSSAMHLLLPEDEQMRRILSRDEQVVVTVQARRGRHNLRTEPSLPPVVSIRRREPPPCESTDDSFMKELKRRRRGFFTGRRSEDLSTAATTKSTRRSASTSAAAAAAAAGHSNSSLRQPAPPPTAVFGRQQIVRTPDTAFGTAAAVHGFSKATNPTEQRNATTQPTSNKRETPAPVNRTTSGDRMLNVTHKTDVAAQAAVKRVVCDERSSKDRNEYTPAGEPRDSTKRTLFSPPARNAACEADANATESHSVSEAQVRYVKQSEQNAKETGAQRGAVSVECGRDMPRACLHNAEESRDARPDEKDCVSLTGVAEFQEACSEADSTLEIRTGLKQGRLTSSEEIIKGTLAGHQPTPARAAEVPCSEVSLLQDYDCPRFNARTPDLIQAERIRIEEIGEMANLLSALIGKHAKNVRAPSLENSTKTDAQPLSTTEHTCPGEVQERQAPVSARPHLDRAEEPISTTAIDIRPGVEAQKLPVGTKFQASFRDQREEQVTEGHPSEKKDASNTNATDHRTELKLSAQPNVRSKTCRSITVREAVWPSWVEIIENTLSEMRPALNFVAVDQPSPVPGPNLKIADDTKCASKSEKVPESITVYSPQDRRGSIRLGASPVPETNFEGMPATRELSIKEEDETTVCSPTFSAADRLRSFLRKQASASSVASETAPSLSLQSAYRKYMAHNFELPVNFAERPFAEVLASLESEMASIAKDEPKADSKHEKTASDAITKPPDTEVLQSSSQYDMNDEDLDAAAMELSSPEDAASDSRAGVGSDEAVETCTSASSVKAPYIGCLASAPARTLEGEKAFKSTPGACAVQDDSVDGPIALPETKLPTFLSSTSNASHAPTNDRVEPKRSEQNTAATTHEANHGIAILMQPQAASSPMVQKHNFRQRASFKSDCGIQTQPPTPYPGTLHLPQQEKVHELDGVRVATTDLQWTAGVEKVLMLGNECCLMQHPPQRTAPESATRLDKTQYVLFHVEDHGHPSTSAEPRTVASSSCTLLGGDLAKDCPESTRDTVTRCHALPSGKERRESEGASCEPPTLKDLIVAHCPVVSSKDLITFHLSQASSVPPLRALCSQVLPSDEKCEEGTRQGVLAESEETLCSRTSFEHASVTGATPSETPCRQKVLNSRLPLGSLSTPVADDQPSTSSGAADVQLRRRGRSQSVGATTIPFSRPDQGRRLSNKAAAAEPAKGPIRFLGPLSSQNVVVLPESSVAICLPEGASRDDLWAPLSASSLRQSNTAGGSGLRHRHLLLASALEEPSFESVYNAILLPRLAAQEASVMPGDVPCRPTRSTSSSRAVSFDNSPTVVPLEPPPAPFAQCGVSQTTADAQPVLPPPFYRPRRRSSLCRSSSGSLLQEILEAADLCPASGSRRAFCRIPSILLEPDGARDATALTDNAGPETRSGSAPPIPEVRSPLISPFYSFENTVSEHSSLPETVRFDSSRRCPALQKSEGEQRDGPAS